jgi:hypothetical protein
MNCSKFSLRIGSYIISVSVREREIKKANLLIAPAPCTAHREREESTSKPHLSPSCLPGETVVEAWDRNGAGRVRH